MKIYHKKLLISGTALTVAGILGIGTLMQTSISVQASAAMMPGIETIVNETSKEEPFRILELVDKQEEAEIGYYVSGQEPYFKLYKFPEDVEAEYLDDAGNTMVYNNITSVQDILSRLATPEQRRDFMQNTVQNPEESDESFNAVSDSEMTGRTKIKNIRSICSEDGPLDYTPYQETYFPNEEQADWQQVDLAKARTVQLNGTYEKSETGNGDYHREALAFYPIRKGTADGEKDSAKYRENIESFSYSMEGKNQPYEVLFGGVQNNVTSEEIKNYYENGMGLYTNVYGYLTSTTDLESFKLFPGEDLENPLPETLKTTVEEAILQPEEALQSAEIQPETVEFFSDGSSSMSSNFGEEEDFGDANSMPGTMNPAIYRDEEIPVFPFHRYYYAGTYNEIMGVINSGNPEVSFGDNNDFSDANSEESFGENSSYYADGEGNYYWRNTAEGAADQRLVYVIGREKQPYSNTQPLPEDYGIAADSGQLSYYYAVASYALACVFPEGGDQTKPDSYQYTGWYYAINPANEERFVDKGEKIAEFYSSDEEFTLTPGKGDYNFIPDEAESEKAVQVNSFSYSGGYTNHDWLKKYVFNLFPDTGNKTKEQFESFAIEVDTWIKADLGKEVLPSEEAAKSEYQVPPEEAAQSEDKIPSEETVQSEDQVPPKEEAQSKDVESSEGEETEVFSEGQESEVVPMLSENQEELTAFENSREQSIDLPEGDEQQAEFGEWTDGGGTEEGLAEESFEAESGNEEDFTDAGELTEESAFSAEDGEVFSAGTEIGAGLVLEDYDLIYINGHSSQETAEKIAASKIPCIINQDKADDAIKAAFAEYLLPEDEDQHYVSKQIYFFHTKGEEPDVSQSSELVNPAFYEDFNLSGDELTDGKLPEAMLGFEEVLDYINSENQYRKITDKEPLSTAVSQARVIEYILNFAHKRSTQPNGTINVLEIEPARSDGQVTETDVLEWLGYEIIDIDRDRAEFCCQEAKAETDFFTNIFDGNNETFWHSQWWPSIAHKGNHWFKLMLTESTNLRGITYLPRQDSSFNGTVTAFTLTLFDEAGKELGSYKSTFANDKKEKNFYFKDQAGNEEVVQGVKAMKLEVTKGENGFASCAEFSVILDSPEVNITKMTSSEFAGHVEDLNTKYNIIYIGDDESAFSDNTNKKYNFRPENYLYYHIGAAKQVKGELQGLMNQDYTINEKGEKVLAKIQDQIGLVRGSGNDITRQQVDNLIDFADSGYPIVVAGGLYNDKKEVSETLVDNSSYIYDFLDAVKRKENVVRSKDITKINNINFYANLLKPEIVFEKDAKGAEMKPPSAIGTVNGPSKEYLTGDAMSFTFQIKDETAVSSAVETYDCKLYLDLNCDGIFSPTTESLDDIEVLEGNRVLRRNAQEKYELRIGTQYTVRRTIPQEYIKLIPWKLSVESNQNPQIRTAENGYSKRGGTAEGKTIRVLQIKPNRECHWDLAVNQTFKNLLDQVSEDFTVKIDSVSLTNYQRNYADDTNYLNQYHMLIIGFCDGPGYASNGSSGTTSDMKMNNFSQEGVKGILDFAKTGKSVIFAHDNTSSSNIARDTKGGSNPETWFGWAYDFNQQLRGVSGMDRYGITNPSISDTLKKAQGLTKPADFDSEASKPTDSWGLVQVNAGDMAYAPGTKKQSTVGETHGFTDAKIGLARADGGGITPPTTSVNQMNEGAITEYPYKIDTTFTVADTHLQYYQLALEEDQDQDGANDIVVWYCLGENGKKDNFYWYSPNDARNSYYIYSDKNIIYTGVGHSNVKGNPNNLNDPVNQEQKLFVNTIIAAYNAQAVSPEVEFIENTEWEANIQKYEYFTLNALSNDTKDDPLINSQQFNLRVMDTNLVGSVSNVDQLGDMTLELFYDAEDGEIVEGIGNGTTKVCRLAVAVNKITADGPIQIADPGVPIKVNSGNIYTFVLDPLGDYVKNSANNAYRSNVTIYARVSCTYNYYGELRTASAISQMTLKQRQLFDLD